MPAQQEGARRRALATDVVSTKDTAKEMPAAANNSGSLKSHTTNDEVRATADLPPRSDT
jgi:hypothetical protein